MYTDADLDDAVRHDILQSDSVTAFRYYVEKKRGVQGADEEYIRFLSSFNDVFVIIACGLFLGTSVWVVADQVGVFAGGIFLSAAAWGLAEVFTHRRRMALPSIMLLGAFVCGVMLFVPFDVKRYDIVVTAFGVCAAGIHWWRFRVPIAPTVGVGGVLLCIASFLAEDTDLLVNYGNVIVWGAGVIVFLWAMHWDISDTRRQTRRSDVAFWLHFLAAPLLVHPVFSTLVAGDGHVGYLQAGIIFAAYGGLAIVSLLIDRRALMVSALGYVIFALYNFFEQSAVTASFAATCAVVGAALIFLSVFWGRARALLLPFFPVSFSLRLPRLLPHFMTKELGKERHDCPIGGRSCRTSG